MLNTATLQQSLMVNSPNNSEADMKVATANDDAKEAKKKKDLGCIDYRKYRFARMIFIDDGLASRGLTLPLFIIMMFNAGMQVGSFISIFVATTPSAALDNVRSFLLGTTVALSLFNQYASRHSIAHLHEFFVKSMRSFRTDLAEEKQILDTARNAASSQLNMYVKIFSCNTVAMILAQPLGEWMSGHCWKKLPLQWTFPSENDWTFWAAFLFQIPGTVIANCTGIAIMSFTSITIQMTALFDALVFSIRHIEHQAISRCQNEGIDYGQSLLACLKADVRQYQLLVRELGSATLHLRNTFLVISAAVPMVMACEAYPMLQGNFTPGDLTKSFVFLAVQFTCWAQTCSRLEIMTDRHSKVFDALYGTPWYDADEKFKKLVLTTLTFTTHPKHITARLSNEISATMATFYSFVVSSFNLLNMIRNMS